MNKAILQHKHKSKSAWAWIFAGFIFGLAVLICLILLFWPNSNRLSLTASTTGLVGVEDGQVKLRVHAIDALQPTEELYSIDTTGVVSNNALSVTWDVPREAQKRASYVEVCIDRGEGTADLDKALCVSGDEVGSTTYDSVSCPYYVSANSTGRMAELTGWNKLDDAQRVGCGDNVSFGSTSAVSGLLVMRQGMQVSGGGVLVSENGVIVTKDLPSIIKEIVATQAQPVVQNTTNPVTYLTTYVPVSGSQGPTGATGATGAQGDRGVQGIQGIPGANGLNGVNGTSGAAGPQGPSGAAGPQGAAGVAGATGATGAQGIQGEQGIQGIQGAQGEMGIATVSGGGLILTGSNLSLTPCAAGQLLKFDGTNYVCANDINTDTNTDEQQLTWDAITRTLSLTSGGSVVVADANTTYSAGTGLSLTDTTFALNDTGVAPGSYNLVTVDAQGRVTGASNVNYLTNEQDGVIGNEITDVVAGSGLVRTGTGTAADPYRVGLLTTCSTGQLLKWNGTSWACANDTDTNTDQQTLSWNATTNILTIAGGNAVNLASLLDNTDNQVLSVTGTGASRQITISGGNTIAVPDTDSLASLSCTTAQVAKWNGTAWVCANDIDTDTNTTYSAGNGLTLSGTSFSLAQQGATADQVLSWNGTAWVPVAATVDTNTDQQTLSLSGSTLSISNGNSVNLNAFLDNTDNQALSWNAATRTLSLTNGGSAVISDANTTYSASNGIAITGTTFRVNAPTCTGTTKLQWNGTAFICAVDVDTNSGGTVTSITAGTGLTGGTIASSGTVSIANTGVIAGTYGSTTSVPVLTVNEQGQITSATSQPIVFPSEQDGIVGNEVVGGTGMNSGLVRSGAGTVVDPYTLAVNVGNGLQVSGNQVAIIAPTCTGTTKLQWNGTAFICAVDVDTNTDQQTLSSSTSVPDVNNATTTTVDISGGNSVQFIDRDTTYSAGTGISFTGTTINNTGILGVAGSGAITSTGGQNATVGVTTSASFTQGGGTLDLSATGVAAGTYNTVTVDAQGRITSGGNVAYLTNEQDGIVGNEITDVVAGSGLVRTGAGTQASPYRVGLVTTCSTGQLLKWNGTAWACANDIDTDTNTDQQTLALAGATLSISGGNSVNLAPFLDNTDNQALAWAAGTRTLTLTNGGSVVIADADTTYTANSGLTMTGTNTQLGGTLLKDTTIAQAGYKMNFTGGELMSQRQGADSNYVTFQSGENLMNAGISGIMTAVTPSSSYAGGRATYNWLRDGLIMTSVTDATGNTSNIATTPAAIAASASDGTQKTELILNNAGTASLSSYSSAALAFNGNHSQFVFNANGTASITSKGTAGAMRANYDPTRVTFNDYASGTDVPRFTIDNMNKRVQIGSSASDAVAMTLVLDSYNVATDPAGVNGAMYYNTALAKFRCYENSVWKNCIGASPTAGKTVAVNVPAATHSSTVYTPGTITQTVTFGTARPTATYTVLCTANTAVNCAVTARTTTGFTVTFTNTAASVQNGTVADWFIVE